MAAQQIARPWRPAPALSATALFHAGVAFTLAAQPALWPWGLAALLGNHMLLGMAILWPRGRLLGPNIVRLPEQARQRGEVALTFDDGPDPAITPRVLDLLDRHQAKASFFCIGVKARSHPELIREIVRRGHSVENHSLCHYMYFALYGLARLSNEVETTQALISDITGRRPDFFRAPGGFRSPLLDLVLCRTGLRYVSWTRRGFDAVSVRPARILRRLTRGLAAGDVLLLHDNRKVALEVLPALLERLAQARLKSVSLPAAYAEGSAS